MKKISILLVLTLALQITMFSQSCLPEGILFYTQEQIDNFQTNYPDCEEIEGDVSIGMGYPTDITNLNGLSVIKAIGGDLDINSHTLLTNLSGLDALETIGGDFILYDNESISSITGLGTLTSIGGQFRVYENDVLAGLDNMNELIEIGGVFTIGHNPILEGVSMEKLISVGGMDFSYVFNLQSLEGLGSLEVVGGYLSIKDCTSLPDLDGLNSLTTIHESLGLLDNDILDNLDGLENLTTVGGSISLLFASGYCISNIEGLSSLTSVGGDLNIAKTNVQSLAGLESLTSINGDLDITNNPLLTSIEGIKNINSDGILNLEIRFNPLLSDCAVKSVCDYLGVSARYIQIHDNADGCNSQQEVEAGCVSGIGDTEYGNIFTIYPNPANNEVTIDVIEGIVIDDIRLFNILGQEIDVNLDGIGTLDVTYLEKGIYTIELSANNTTSRKKLIVE